MATVAEHLEGGPFYRELDAWCQDTKLVGAIRACLAAQRRVAEGKGFHPETDPAAARIASEEELRELLSKGQDVRGVATDPGISNVQSFNARNLEQTWIDREVAARRRDLDRLVARKIRETFPHDGPLVAITSGHWWYPPGSAMGWHTNSDSPGWRLYLTHAEEPDRSGFRYLDPKTGEVVTSLDSEWDVRIFYIPRDPPFWHAVFSDTNRFSFGYLVRPRSWTYSAIWHLRRLGQAARRQFALF